MDVCLRPSWLGGRASRAGHQVWVSLGAEVQNEGASANLKALTKPSPYFDRSEFIGIVVTTVRPAEKSCC